jgi:hypothetical protein
MCTLLAKLAIGLSVTMTAAFYYLAAAPPSAAVDVCGPGNFSPACASDNTPSPVSPDSVPSAVPDPVPDPVPNPIPDPAPNPVPDPIPDPVPKAPQPDFGNIYKAPRAATSIPEPGTAIAVLLTGVGMICSGRKRNKRVDRQP